MEKMTPVTTIEQQNFDYLSTLPNTIYLGMQPLQYKSIILEVNRLFNAAPFLQPDAIYDKIIAIGIFDAERNEHVYVFENIKSFQACLNFVYGSSMVISRRWYLARTV